MKEWFPALYKGSISQGFGEAPSQSEVRVQMWQKEKLLNWSDPGKDIFSYLFGFSSFHSFACLLHITLCILMFSVIPFSQPFKQQNLLWLNPLCIRCNIRKPKYPKVMLIQSSNFPLWDVFPWLIQNQSLRLLQSRSSLERNFERRWHYAYTLCLWTPKRICVNIYCYTVDSAAFFSCLIIE